MKRTCALAICGVAAASEMKLYESSTRSERTWEAIRKVNFYARNTWEGMYLGLYGPTSTIEKIDDDCFGDWIPDDMEFIHDFFHKLGHDVWSITYEDSTQLAYNIVDLMFLNDQYCHFRTSLWDIVKYCKEDDHPCKGKVIAQNLQTNAFGMITQISSIVQSFTAKKWNTLDEDGKAYTLHQLGESTMGLFVDFFGFHPIF